MYRSSVIFMPSAQSLGSTEDASKGAGPTFSADGVAELAPAIRGVLGLDDPTQSRARIQAQLRTLKAGGPPAVAQAWLLGTMGNVPNAIKKVKDKLAATQEQAFQSETRNKLYTALSFTGVAVGAMLSLWVGAKTYGAYQEARLVKAQIRRQTEG